jgi:hypothetical protein
MSLALDFVRFRLKCAARWRRDLTARFPADLRNKHAAEALSALAIDPHHSVAFADAVQAVGKAVHFRVRPAGLDAFLKLVLTELETAGAR